MNKKRKRNFLRKTLQVQQQQQQQQRVEEEFLIQLERSTRTRA